MRFFVFEVLFQEDILLLPRNFYFLFMEVLSGNPEMLSKSRKLFLSISDVFGQGKLNASRVSFAELIYTDEFQWGRSFSTSLGSITGVILVYKA